MVFKREERGGAGQEADEQVDDLAEPQDKDGEVTADGPTKEDAPPAGVDTDEDRADMEDSAGDEAVPAAAYPGALVLLERAFDKAMVDLYRRARVEAGYNATLFLTMLSERGGLRTARSLLNAAKPSDGFAALWERKRLDLSVEAVILESRFDSLFTDEERERARDRLAQYGFTPRMSG